MRCEPAACLNATSRSALRAAERRLWPCCALLMRPALTACATQTFCNRPEVPRFDHDQVGHLLPRLREQWPYFTGDARPALPGSAVSALCGVSLAVHMLPGAPECLPWYSALFALQAHA